MSRAENRELLAQSLRLQQAAAEQGFDWRIADELWEKLAEEIAELRAACTAEEREEELGDLLFMLVNLARHLQVDPVLALQGANRKFERRYAHIDGHRDRLPPLGDPARLEAMEALWQAAKRIEKSAKRISGPSSF